MPTDAELIGLYWRRGDETAFAELVRRHGPMVYRVCLRLLGDPFEAEDASQAAFVVLAKRARSIRRPAQFASWLHGVARRVALEALRARQRRARHEEEAGVNAHRGSVESAKAELSVAERAEALEALDREVDALPARERQAVVLRYLEGCSQKDAAAVAGVPQGTLARRASEGLERLRTRMARRGALLSGLGAAALVSLLEAEASAAVPATLFPSLSAAAGAATGAAIGAAGTGAVSSQAAFLAEGVLKMIFWAKVKMAAAVVVAVTVMGVGAPVAVRALAEDGADPGAEERGLENGGADGAEVREDANNVRRPENPGGNFADPSGADGIADRMTPGRRLLAIAMKDPAFRRLYKLYPRVQYAAVGAKSGRATPGRMQQTVQYRTSENVKGRGLARRTLSVAFVISEEGSAPTLLSRNARAAKVPVFGWNKAFVFLDRGGKVQAVYQYDVPRAQGRNAQGRGTPEGDPAGANVQRRWQNEPE